MSPFTTTTKLNLARLLTWALLTPYIRADLDAQPDPAQKDHLLITPPPKLSSKPQKRDFLDDCFGEDTGSCNMYMTVQDLCDILADDENHDLANNECLCSNGYVPALSRCDKCELRYKSEVIYPASWASSSCIDDGFSIAKMSNKIPLSIEDLVRPSLLSSSGPTETGTTTTEETSTSTSTSPDDDSGLEATSTTSKQFNPVGMPPPAGGAETAAGETTSETPSGDDPQFRATQTIQDGDGKGDGGLPMRGGGWEAGMLALALSGGSMMYHLFL